jgi:PleD family two-component response regulator
VSIGLAPSENALSLEELLRDADRALYRAKDAGRDRVMLTTAADGAAAA